jgi:hypothetical protein
MGGEKWLFQRGFASGIQKGRSPVSLYCGTTSKTVGILVLFFLIESHQVFFLLP